MLSLTLNPPAGLAPKHYQGLVFGDELLLCHQALSRTGGCDDGQIERLAAWCKTAGKRCVLVWDLLADDGQLARGAEVLRGLLQYPIHAIRVQDPGVAAYVAHQFPKHQLQLILETGNHNRVGIEAWIKHIKPQRVVLSNEVPLNQIAEFCTELGVETEVMAMGRLLIFYSPRKLAGAEGDRDEFDVLERFATEKESGKHFPIVENRHGTFMYYEKDLFLLPYLKEIEQAGLNYARLDLSAYDVALLAPLKAYLAQGNDGDPTDVKRYLAPRLTRGFFKSNRTDKQFKKLTNPNLAFREDKPYVGTVVETAKKKYTAIHTQVKVREGDTLLFATPEGDMIEHKVFKIRQPGGEKVSEAQAGLWLVDHVRGVSAGSKIYLSSPLN